MDVTFEIANCPECGKYLHELTVDYAVGGHLRVPKHMLDGVRTLPFMACRHHFESADRSLTKKAKHCGRDGYRGQWEPRLGLVAAVDLDESDEVKIVPLA